MMTDPTVTISYRGFGLEIHPGWFYRVEMPDGGILGTLRGLRSEADARHAAHDAIRDYQEAR